jgi:hypothetical protein
VQKEVLKGEGQRVKDGERLKDQRSICKDMQKEGKKVHGSLA